MFCYGNNTYSTLMLRNASSQRTIHWQIKSEPRFEWHSLLRDNWVTEPLLSEAPVAATPWLLLRDQVTWE